MVNSLKPNVEPPDNPVAAGVTDTCEWVSVSVAARKLRLSRRQTWRLIASGELPSELVEGRRWVLRSAVEAKKTCDIAAKCHTPCHTDQAYKELVTEVIARLKPAVEQTVRDVLEDR